MGVAFSKKTLVEKISTVPVDESDYVNHYDDDKNMCDDDLSLVKAI